ncbi:MAG TPA: formimidoylglutamate deiminase, partial [Actinomycetota bacterium]|nr:formimidoylglutamate deiminase [Actinomycetota bacterium]
VRLAGTRPADAVDHLVFVATAADVTSVVVSGRQVVRDGRHLLVPDVAAALDRAIGALLELAH